MTEPTKRSSLAVTSAIASVAVAIGVTTASLLGWFAPARAPSVDPAPSPPVTAVAPAAEPPAIAASTDEPALRRHHDDDDHHDDDGDSDEDSDD